MRISIKSTKPKSLQRWAKIVVVNLLVFLFLLVVAEILARSVWTVQSCIKSECDFSRFADLKVRKIYRGTNIGFTLWNADQRRLLPLPPAEPPAPGPGQPGEGIVP